MGASRLDADYLDDLRQAAQVDDSELVIVPPWSIELEPRQRAAMTWQILDAAYSGRYPIRDFFGDTEGLQRRQVSKRFLTWLLLWRGEPVGTSSIELDRASAWLVSSARWPWETRLASGALYTGRHSVGVLMARRILDLLCRRDLARRIATLDADVRITGSIDTGQHVIASGVSSQRNHRLAGLTPMLLCLPKYVYSPPSGMDPVQHLFVHARRYLARAMVMKNRPLYVVDTRRDGIAPKAIAELTYEMAFGAPPRFAKAVRRKAVRGRVRKTVHGSGHFATLSVEGTPPPVEIRRRLRSALETSAFVEVCVENSPDCLGAQRTLVELGCAPLGVLPGYHVRLGGRVRNVPTTIHFGIRREDIPLGELDLLPEWKCRGLDETCQKVRARLLEVVS